MGRSVDIVGLGAVSPAGIGVQLLTEAVRRGEPLPPESVERPGWDRPLQVRSVPPNGSGSLGGRHPRLRRSSPIARYAVTAAQEALGEDGEPVANGRFELGVLVCVMSGSVSYSRRFYDEVWNDPSTASPLIFPETVFNAPAGHLSAVLGAGSINYTLVGDAGMFLQAIAIGASWVKQGRVDGVLAVAAEEKDWITADASRLFSRSVILGEGAAAVYLKADDDRERAVSLRCVTDAYTYTVDQDRRQAAREMRKELPAETGDSLLCLGLGGTRASDRVEDDLWSDWKGPKQAPKRILGEGLATSAGWQCVAAVDALRAGEASRALVSVVGCQEQAIGAEFVLKDGGIVT